MADKTAAGAGASTATGATAGAASGALTVQVTNLSTTTTQTSLEEYFSFCGSIASAKLEKDGDEKQKASIRFLKSSAASNAAMLNGGQLDGSAIHVTIPGVDASVAAQGTFAVPTAGSSSTSTGEGVAQEDKPRTAIIAEYLAHGYKLSDDILKRGIELDQKHGWSQKWGDYLRNIDQRLGEKYQQAQPKGAAAAAPAAATAAGTTEEKTEPSKEKITEPTPAATTAAPASSDAAPASFVAQVHGQAKQLLQDPEGPVVKAQTKATELLNKPQVKPQADWAWSKLGEYYNAAANHPAIKGFYQQATRTVQDVHEEAKRIQAQKAGAAPATAATTSSSATPAGAPAPTSVAKSSTSWLLVGLLLFSSLSIQGVMAHGEANENGDFPPADIAGVAPHKKGEESYVQKHMASEHHIGAFDLGSFFSLHDLNRDGVLDRAEIEAIYGVHHSTSIKHSPNAEVHDEKADTIVNEVLRRMDFNGDGLITRREFITAGPDGLPSFEQYGKHVLGHHYDEESEYFVHHEELYHNTPDTQKDEAYNHKEDIEHFAHHEEIEREEENRERHAEGLPSIEEDEKLRKEAEARGEVYTSPYEAFQHKSQLEDRLYREAQEGMYGGYAQDEAQSKQHVFRGPNGKHVVNSAPDSHGMHELEDRQPGETEEGYAKRKLLWEQRKAAAEYFEKLQKEQAADGGSPVAAAAPEKLTQRPGESNADFRSRVNRAKWEAEKKGKVVTKPKEDSRMKKSGPAKYPPLGQKQSRLKKSSYFGEF